MAEFLAVPDFSIYKDGTWAKPEQWWLHSECIYQSDILGIDSLAIKVTVPKDSSTDLSSIPRLARLFIPKNGRHRAAAVVHDWLCREEITSRKIADKIFLEAMVITKVPKWRRQLMYAGVRIGARLKGSK